MTHGAFDAGAFVDIRCLLDGHFGHGQADLTVKPPILEGFTAYNISNFGTIVNGFKFLTDLLCRALFFTVESRRLTLSSFFR